MFGRELFHGTSASKIGVARSGGLCPLALRRSHGDQQVCGVLWSVLVTLPAFFGAACGGHPRSSIDTADQSTIKEIGHGTASPGSQHSPRRRIFPSEPWLRITSRSHLWSGDDEADTLSARKNGQLRYDTINVSDMVVRVMATLPWSRLGLT